MGIEAFKGDSMRAADEHNEREYKELGVYTAYTKFGGDIGANGSWLAGLSYMRNENGRLTADEHESDEHESEEHEHSHSAQYTGENTYIADFVYKWAPNGNYKYQHLTLSGEYFKVTDFTPLQGSGEANLGTQNVDDQQGWYLSGVYQLSPNWSTGLRYGEVDTQEMHGDHFHPQKLEETELSLAWHNSHFSTVRLQYTNQKGTNFDGIEDDNVFTLQYVMTLGLTVHINSNLVKVAALALSMGYSSLANAGLNIFACEPEYAALVKELAPDAKIYSATTALQDPHQVQARPSLIAKMRQADLAVCAGADLEVGWLPMLQMKSSNANVRSTDHGLFLQQNMLIL